MKLQFNAGAFIADAEKILIETLNKVNSEFYSKAGEADSQIYPAYVEGDKISAICEFYADAIMDSFGTGRLADTGNKYWDDYLGSGLYNPVRNTAPGTPIVGRKAGEYTNIYGEKSESSGKRAGLNVEGVYRPIPASRKIQNAESFLFNDGYHRLEQEVERAFDSWVSQNYSKYFTVV